MIIVCFTGLTVTRRHDRREITIENIEVHEILIITFAVVIVVQTAVFVVVVSIIRPDACRHANRTPAT